jgi:hypothetical protein
MMKCCCASADRFSATNFRRRYSQVETAMLARSGVIVAASAIRGNIRELEYPISTSSGTSGFMIRAAAPPLASRQDVPHPNLSDSHAARDTNSLSIGRIFEQTGRLGWP